MKLKSSKGKVYTTQDPAEITRLKASGYTEVKQPKAPESKTPERGKK